MISPDNTTIFSSTYNSVIILRPVPCHTTASSHFLFYASASSFCSFLTQNHLPFSLSQSKDHPLLHCCLYHLLTFNSFSHLPFFPLSPLVQTHLRSLAKRRVRSAGDWIRDEYMFVATLRMQSSSGPRMAPSTPQ